MQGVGKVVSYTNADRILPRELLDAIQQFAGKYPVGVGIAQYLAHSLH